MNLKKLPKILWVALASVCVVGIGAVDLATGEDTSLELFYLVPIAMLTWYTGRTAGILGAFACVLAWAGTDLAVAGGQPRLEVWVSVWNVVMRLGFFLIVSLLITDLKRSIERERMLNRTDSLTGALSAHYFTTLMEFEIAQLRRHEHPFTLVYIDIDNFKAVNDKFGHSTGDELLRKVVETIRKHLRATDMVGRLGGDEFAVLLPETTRAEAERVWGKVSQALLTELAGQGWPVTLSSGALTCTGCSVTVNEMLKEADELMYSVKNRGKNNTAYADCSH